MRFEFLYNFCLKHFAFYSGMSEIWLEMCSRVRVKWALYSSSSKENRIFSTDLFKNIQISIFIKIRAVGAELFLAYRRSDRHDQANSRFSQFRERALKNFL